MTESELFNKLVAWVEENFPEDLEDWQDTEEMVEMVDLIDFFETHLSTGDFYQALCEVDALTLA